MRLDVLKMERERFSAGARATAVTVCFLFVFWVGRVSPLNAEDKQKDIAAFIQQEYLYGIPCREAKSFGRPAVVELAAMLEDPHFEPYWENVVHSLGCIADPSAVIPLEKFLERHQGQISLATFSALQGVPTALAFISHSGNQEAMDSLSRLALNGYWEKAKLKIFDKVVVDSKSINKNLMRSTIVALGYSGQKEAQGVLRKMHDDPYLAEDYRDDIRQAMEGHN